jgi:hypothetical protein
LFELFTWLNENQGVVSALIFAVTIFLGWVSGIFGSLRRTPKLRLQLLPGPTFCSTFPTGKKQAGHDTHRTAISLYVNIANVGSAPTSVDNVELGYHWHVRPFFVDLAKIWRPLVLAKKPSGNAARFSN